MTRRGAVHIIDAFLASLLIATALLYSFQAPLGEIQTEIQGLSATGYQIILSLDGNNSLGDLILNTQTREVWRGERSIELTTKEYVILEYFMRHPHVVVTRTMLEEHAWDYDFDSMSNLVDVYIRRLRRTLDDGSQSLLQTVRGAGYRLKAQ